MLLSVAFGKPKAIAYFLALVCLVVADLAATPEPVVPKLDFRSAQLRQLKAEISANLRSSAKTGELVYPLRFVRYRVRRGEDFFEIMGRVSQNMDTLASVNGIINPNALSPGTLLRIPNARGLFAEGKKKDIARHLGVPPARLVASGNLYFVPGQRFSNEERDYFLGRGFLPPLQGRITSGYGVRRDPFTQRAVFHGGLDIGAPSGTAVHASKAGRIVFSGRAGGYGQLVVIQHRFGYKTYYGHLSKILARKGSKVRAGQLIGRVGSTGRATGPHLHYEVRKNGVRRAPTFIHRRHALR